MVSRIFQGGAIYSETFVDTNPRVFIIIYSSQLPHRNIKTWQPNFLAIVKEYIKQVATTTKRFTLVLV